MHLPVRFANQVHVLKEIIHEQWWKDLKHEEQQNIYFI